MAKQIERILKVLPEIIKNSTNLFVNNLDENAKDIVNQASGTIGILLKLFGKPAIDKFYENRSKNKLVNFGTETYLEAAQRQVSNSMQIIQDEINSNYAANQIIEILSEISSKEAENINPENLLVVFQPQYHPAIEFVKGNQIKLLEKLDTKSTTIETFIKDFNKNIKRQVEATFGEDYLKHLKEIKEYIRDEDETKILVNTIKMAKIGFESSEDLLYEETFGEWNPVHELKDYNDYQKENPELRLKPVNSLIEDYFSENKTSIENILFIIADFGKGKSVFMKHYAALHARNYIKTNSGYFPIYLNLREYSSYKSEEKLGVIANFLIKRYGFDIEKHKNKKFLFLIDSLDESGDLSQHSIDEVVNSIEKIQNLEPESCRENRIIITSRPINEGLISHMCKHKPFIIKNKDGRDIHHYISIYGFKKSQFNDWLNHTLKKSNRKPDSKDTVLIHKILSDIEKGKTVDIYKELLSEKTLSASELQRPIFGYMIYQLIIKNVDIIEIGKIGIYLSFINLLTKEAKHISDVNYKVNLIEEFEFRNILHATASLWMYERQKGKQGTLTKADICRVLDTKNTNDSDEQILEKFKNQGFTDIKFLSHSYFGENENKLHFQHQSFAEILLAEYYLKIFIKYALDKDSDIETARQKLSLGIPTNQTIEFLKEMLSLLKITASKDQSKGVIEKRKLLLPLMASLSNQKNNKFFCNDLHYDWFNKAKFNENDSIYPDILTTNWCINEEKLGKINVLAASILNSKNSYIIAKATPETALINNEITVLQNEHISKSTNNIDQWLALLVGNELHNNITKHENLKLFNWDYSVNYENIFNLINLWNFSFRESAPDWARAYFQGIKMIGNKNEISLSHYNFDGIDFSNSYFEKITCWSANWSRCNLDNCTFKSVQFITSLFFDTSIQVIKDIIPPFRMSNCHVDVMGFKLLDVFNTHNMIEIEKKSKKSNSPIAISSYGESENSNRILKSISGFIIFGLQRKIFTINYLKQCISFEKKGVQSNYIKFLERMKKYENEQI